MNLFWISVAGLMVLAMAFIVLPLLRKRDYSTLSADELNLSVFKQQLEELDNDLTSGLLDQARYDAARKDLEKELLVDVNGDKVQPAEANVKSGRWVMSVALVMPLLALLMYQILGSPEIITQLEAAESNNTAETATSTAHAQGSTDDLPPMEELVKKLAAKMEAQPENLDGWLMLGRSYMAMNQPTDAIVAYERAMNLNAENPTLLLAYAEALAKMAGNNFTGKPSMLIEQAYKLNDKDPNAIWMMGIAAYQSERFKDALGYWEQLESMLTPQSKDIAAVQSAIKDVRIKLGQESELPSIVTPEPAQEQVAEADNSVIEVIIKLLPELRDKADPNDLVFIYAKAISGPPMPLAAVRKQVKDLPLTIILDDSMAMMPQMKLSAHAEVVVGARISRSGTPSAQSGDLEGEIKPVKPGQAGPVMLTIDSIHP